MKQEWKTYSDMNCCMVLGCEKHPISLLFWIKLNLFQSQLVDKKSTWQLLNLPLIESEQGDLCGFTKTKAGPFVFSWPWPLTLPSGKVHCSVRMQESYLLFEDLWSLYQQVRHQPPPPPPQRCCAFFYIGGNVLLLLSFYSIHII